ncbi:MAG: diguanylate cyclase [Ketobacteraceae bacterium]|nr:diguanylate cyclase [Ketobacteraceae bacterium]
MSMTQDPQDWKEKYLSSLESFERLQKADRDRLDILKKGFVRVSLAADGQDATLDEKLAELRTELRSNRDILELEPQIASLEQLVVALDERRQDEIEAIEELIGGSLDEFLETGLPRKKKSLIRKYQKALPKLLEGSGNRLELWKEYSDIQHLLADHIRELENDEDGGRQSLFQRLLGGGASAARNRVSGQSTAGDDSEAPRDPEEEQERDALADDDPLADDARRYVDSALSRQTEAVVPPADEARREQLRQRIASVLSSLLLQIDLPDESIDRRNHLVNRIESTFCWEELPDLLEEAAELVTSTRARVQQEFEGFLVALHERLRDIQDFLQAARKGEEQSQLNQQQLDSDVRTELKEIRSTVEGSNDIGRIKMDIESMVERIVSVVDEFHRQERDRREEVYERIETLGQRMQAMESEANELRDSLETTRIQAMKDALTELPNRQAYNEHIEREYSRWKRRSYPLSIAICDIDNFKAINDNLGHLRGDKVLKLVARELSRRVRNEDFVARYGGEEFIIVMPDTDEPSAVAAVEKVRACIEDCPFNFNNERIPVTASFGVTSFYDNDTIESCFERADKALYKAKAAGRNRVVRMGG